MITITLELTPEQAAALKRFSSNVSYEKANSALYPHVSSKIRDGQVSDILTAFSRVYRALADAQVSSFPWIDTGRVI